jgi:hypothetical protein
MAEHILATRFVELQQRGVFQPEYGEACHQRIAERYLDSRAP